MPVRVGEMNLAVPVTAALTILLSAVIAGFVYARNCLTKLFFGFYGRCSHGILHGTKSGALEKGNSGGAFDHAHFVHAAAGNIHPPVRSGRHIPDRATARRNVRARKLFSFLLRMRSSPPEFMAVSGQLTSIPRLTECALHSERSLRACLRSFSFSSRAHVGECC
jgi:hypothetical protein